MSLTLGTSTDPLLRGLRGISVACGERWGVGGGGKDNVEGCLM